jgi:hypothetical protein
MIYAVLAFEKDVVNELLERKKNIITHFAMYFHCSGKYV